MPRLLMMPIVESWRNLTLSDNNNLPAKRSQAFLSKVRQSKALTANTKKQTLAKALTQSGRSRLLFSMDATKSREASWNVAKEITGAMFEAVPGALDVALTYHSGGRLRELTPFSDNAQAFLDKVQAVECQAGMTALNQILDEATRLTRLKALIYVGDCFEENAEEALDLARLLKLKGVRCFLFHDSMSRRQGYDTDTAKLVFQQIARITGGALFPFDESSPGMVKALLEAIALYAASGMKALEAKTKFLPAAKLLLAQMNPLEEGS